MNVERLIEEVRKFPVLYDQTNKKYRNTEYKDRVWKKIAIDMQVKDGIEECKKRWTSVRDQLRKTVQKRKTVSGQAAVRQHKYKYEDQLMFLLPYMVERETISSVSYTHDDDDSRQESNTDAQEEQSILEEEESTQQDNADEELITQECETQNVTDRAQLPQAFSAASSVTLKKKNTSTKPLLKRKLQRENSKARESASSQLMAYILAEKQAENQATRSLMEREVQNPVDAFLAGIAPSLKSLHPIIFNQAKNKIFSIVQECELKQLLSNEQMRQFPPSSSDSSPTVVSTPYPSPMDKEVLNPTQHFTHQQIDSHDSFTNNQSHYRPNELSSQSSVPLVQNNSLSSPEPFFFLNI